MNESTYRSTGVNRVPTPENPGVVMAKIAQSSQLVGVIDIQADTIFPTGALRYVQQKLVNDLTSDDEPVMPLEKKDLSGDVVSRTMLTKMIQGPLEDDRRQMYGHFVGETYIPETYVRQDFSNSERERTKKEQKYVSSAEVQNRVLLENNVMTETARRESINQFCAYVGHRYLLCSRQLTT